MATLSAQRSRFSNDHPTVGLSLVLLSNVLRSQGKLPEAETTFREAIAIMKKSFGPEHPQISMLLPNLAVILQMQGRLPEAEAVYREAIALEVKVLGKDHPMITNVRAMLVQVLQQQRKTAEAEAVQKEVVTVATPAQAPGTEEIMAADKKTRIAMAAMQQQKFAEAEKNLREALPVLEQALGGAHQGVIGTRIVLAQALLQLGKFAEAEAVMRDLLPIIRQAFGNKSTIVATTLFNLAASTQLQGKLVEAETALNEALAISKQQTADGENANVAAALLQLATVKAGQGASRSEIEILRIQAANIARKLPASMVAQLPSTCGMMFDLLMKYDKPAQAEPIERVLIDCIRQIGGGESEELAWRLTTLTWVLNLNGKFAEGEAVAREAVDMRRKLLPANAWQVYAAKYSVGESLLGQKKYAEAEKLFLEVFTGLNKRPPEDASPFQGFWKGQFKHTAERLVELYTETKQPAQATEWQKKVDAYVAAEKAAAAAVK